MRSHGTPHEASSSRTEAVDFTAAQVVSADMQMRYVDPQNAIKATDSFKLLSSADTHQFAFDYLNPAISAEYKVDVQLMNGQTRSIDWSPVSGDTVTITLTGLA